MTDEKTLLSAVAIVFLILQFVVQLVNKKSNIEILNKLDMVIASFTSMVKDLTQEIKEKRHSYTIPTDKILSLSTENHLLLNSIKETQRDISSILLETSLAQKSTAMYMERLMEKLSKNSDDCKERSEKTFEKISGHVAEAHEANILAKAAKLAGERIV